MGSNHVNPFLTCDHHDEDYPLVDALVSTLIIAMAASPTVGDVDAVPPQDKWGPGPDVSEHLGHVGVGDLDRDLVGGPPLNNGDSLGPLQDHSDSYHPREGSEDKGPIYREKQIKVVLNCFFVEFCSSVVMPMHWLSI